MKDEDLLNLSFKIHLNKIPLKDNSTDNGSQFSSAIFIDSFFYAGICNQRVFIWDFIKLGPEALC